MINVVFFKTLIKSILPLMYRKKVFILILNWNSYDETINLLTILQKQTYTDFKTIVIDNNSTDRSIEKLKPYTESSILLIQNKKNLGYAGGNNIGIDIAINEQADYVWILNPDIRPEPETLSILIESIDRSSSFAAIGPRICYRDKPDTIYSDGALIIPERGFLVIHKNNNQKIKPVSDNKIKQVDYVNGSAILMRVKTLREIGKFREDFFLYYDETEWCLRAKRRGWQIANNSKATVYHKSSPKGFLYHYFMARNRILLAKVLREYRYAALKVEIYHLRKFIKKPFHKNLLYFFARLKGISCGLVKCKS